MGGERASARGSSTRKVSIFEFKEIRQEALSPISHRQGLPGPAKGHQKDANRFPSSTVRGRGKFPSPAGFQRLDARRSWQARWGRTGLLDNRQSNVYHRFKIEGRHSSMTKQEQQRIGLLQGTLDMLILRTLLYGPAHGHQIGKHIQRTTNDFLQMQHGSLYPALHRLERRGWVEAKWETAPDRNREFKYYRLTELGKKQLVTEESQWKQMAEAVARVMWPTPPTAEES